MELSALTLTTVVASLFCYLLPADGALCSDPNPTEEKAYDGPYSIDFPPHNSLQTPSNCKWEITAYRLDYVVHLQFEDVLLDPGDKITVYDGGSATPVAMATICGSDNPELVTSTQEALIVFSSTNSSLGSTKFKVKYKAVRDRSGDQDSSQILRIAFGCFIGTVALIIVCSGVCRKLKYRERRLLHFGGRRVSSDVSGPGTTTVHNSSEGDSPQATPAPPQPVTVRSRVGTFFQSVLVKLNLSRYFDTMERADSNGRGQGRTANAVNPRQQLRQAGQAVNRVINRDGVAGRRQVSNRGTSVYSDEFESDVSVTCGTSNAFADDLDGHAAQFRYQSIPLSSFTSDPAAVKPPTYEESVNSVNPLYLYHHQQSSAVFSNPAFSVKDEHQVRETAGIFSPPPPYSELGPDIGSSHLLGGGNPSLTLVAPAAQNSSLTSGTESQTSSSAPANVRQEMSTSLSTPAPLVRERSKVERYVVAVVDDAINSLMEHGTSAASVSAENGESSPRNSAAAESSTSTSQPTSSGSEVSSVRRSWGEIHGRQHTQSRINGTFGVGGALEGGAEVLGESKHPSLTPVNAIQPEPDHVTPRQQDNTPSSPNALNLNVSEVCFESSSTDHQEGDLVVDNIVAAAITHAMEEQAGSSGGQSTRSQQSSSSTGHDLPLEMLRRSGFISSKK